MAGRERLTWLKAPPAQWMTLRAMTHARIETTDNQAMPADAAVPRQTARALRLGGRLNLAGLDTADLSRFDAIARSPLVLRLESGGVVALWTDLRLTACIEYRSGTYCGKSENAFFASAP